MSLLDNIVATPRRTMTLFFLADTSGSMYGGKIGAVNDAIRNVLPIVSEISEDNPDAEIKIAALTFSNGCEWIYPEPRLAADFEWEDQTAGGGTDLGDACCELASKLSQSHGFMKSGSGSYAPVLILLSDGGPTDDFDAGMEKLKNNNWYKSAIKVAIAIGDDADVDVLAKFTGNIERVIKVHDIESLKKVIRVVVVTSSQVGSKSTSATVNGAVQTKADEAMQAIKEQVEPEQNIQVGVDAANVDMSDEDWD
jgi:uncharacterized protein YegL